ncbi:C2H2-type zinc finger protein, partial [Xenorhabdus innexi]
MPREYICYICNKSFSYKAVFDEHERTCKGDKPYRCTFDDCKKAFKYRHNLTTHERKHTSEKPFKCHVCGTTFSQQN